MSRLYKNYLLGVLLVIGAFNYVDRQTLGLVLQSIKHDLHLSDTQLGFMSGIAFAIFYAVMGVPIARWADRGNRVTIIAVTTALWSVAVAMCGLAGSFTQLLLIRIGVGVGEAGCIPPAHSLIADYFPRNERPKAIAIYFQGYPLSVIIGLLGAGWLNQLYGWRVTFMLIGLPGVVLSLLAALTLREPRRAALAAPRSETPQAVQLPLLHVLATLWRNRAFRNVLFCLSFAYFFGYGIANWQPAFFQRSYGMQTGVLGTWLAVVLGFSSVIGTFAGGELASRYAASNERLQLRFTSVLYIFFGVAYAFIYLSPNRYLSLLFIAIANLGINMANGPLFATIQTLVPERMRAMAIAIVFLFANLIGMGFGPLAAGALSDALYPAFHQESLRYALLVLCPGFLFSAWFVWQGSRTVERDIATTHGEAEPLELGDVAVQPSVA